MDQSVSGMHTGEHVADGTSKEKMMMMVMTLQTIRVH